MKIRKMVLTACVACLSTLAIVNSANAQAYDPDLRQVLGEREGTISDINDFINQIDPDESQRQLDTLISSCHQGNSSACTEYNLLNRQSDRQFEYNLDRFDSFGNY